MNEVSLCSPSDVAVKRRSWHVDRVAARVFSTLPSPNLPPLSSLGRSQSTEATHISSKSTIQCSSLSHARPMTLSAAQEGTEVAVAEEPVSLDIVGTYAERLSAVTHAFALCCYTLQKASGRLVGKSYYTLIHSLSCLGSSLLVKLVIFIIFRQFWALAEVYAVHQQIRDCVEDTFGQVSVD